MPFDFLKPQEGWRPFAGEVGIIVLGVLIALGAQQLVEEAQWRIEIAAFRKAVNIEVAGNLAAYRYRIQQKPCVQRRIRELDQLGQADRAGIRIDPSVEIGRPALYSFRTNVWRASSPELMNQLTTEVRLTYSSIYDQLGNVESQLAEEREVWRNLNGFNNASLLSEDSRMRLRELIYRAKSVDELIMVNFPVLMSDAAAIGVKPDFGKLKGHVGPPDPQFCRSLFSES